MLYRMSVSHVLNDTHFDPQALEAQIPPLALAYFNHAIRHGAPLASQAEITFHGQIRLRPQGPWLTFHGQETLTVDHAFQVTDHAHLGPLAIISRDWYKNGQAASRIALADLVPVTTDHGQHALRAAQGRFLVESTWLPVTFLPQFGADWREEAGMLYLTLPFKHGNLEAMLSVAASGQLGQLNCQRWSNLTENGDYDWIPFTSYFEAERNFADYTVPSTICSLWWPKTAREFEFFHAEVDNIRYSR